MKQKSIAVTSLPFMVVMILVCYRWIVACYPTTYDPKDRDEVLLDTAEILNNAYQQSWLDFLIESPIAIISGIRDGRVAWSEVIGKQLAKMIEQVSYVGRFLIDKLYHKRNTIAVGIIVTLTPLLIIYLKGTIMNSPFLQLFFTVFATAMLTFGDLLLLCGVLGSVGILLFGARGKLGKQLATWSSSGIVVGGIGLISFAYSEFATELPIGFMMQLRLEEAIGLWGISFGLVVIKGVWSSLR